MNKWTIKMVRDRCTMGSGGCWIWAQACHVISGIPVATIEGGRGISVRRWVYLKHNGQPPGGAKRWRIVSGCGHEKCCNPEHLKRVLPSRVLRDQWLAGSRSADSIHSRARLTDADIAGIRAATGPLSEIGAQWGLSASYAGRIRRGEARRMRVSSIFSLAVSL